METRRRIVLIDKTFQYRLILKFILVNILITFIFGFFIYLFFNSEIDANLQTAHVTYTNVKNMLLPITLTISIINILISSIIIFVFVLFASHKIAGPMFRFNEALRQVAAGNFNTLTSLREEDQLYDCSVTLKEMVNVLSDDLGQIKDKISELDTVLPKANSDPSVLELLKKIHGVLDRYSLLK